MNATPTPRPIRRNDTVWVLDPDTRGPSVQWAGPWRVEKVNQKSYSLVQPVDGPPHRKLRAGKTIVVTEEPTGKPGEMEWRAPWVDGTLVRWTGPNLPKKAGTDLWIILADPGRATVKACPLGNVCGRIWPKVPAEWLTVIDPAKVQILP
jgi:hypothetical protein